MSYEPTLIINKKQFRHALPAIEEDQYSKNIKRKGIAEYLIAADKNRVHNIGGAEIFLCSPEGSQFNKSIRHYLSNLSIEYSENI